MSLLRGSFLQRIVLDEGMNHHDLTVVLSNFSVTAMDGRHRSSLQLETPVTLISEEKNTDSLTAISGSIITISAETDFVNRSSRVIVELLGEGAKLLGEPGDGFSEPLGLVLRVVYIE